MKKYVNKVIVTALSILLFFGACQNGVQFTPPAADKIVDGSNNKQPDNVKLPEFSKEETGENIFTLTVSNPAFAAGTIAEGYTVFDFNPALTAEIFVKPPAGEKPTASFDITIDGIVDDVPMPTEGNTNYVEPSNIILTAEYTALDGTKSDFVTVTFDNKTLTKSNNTAKATLDFNNTYENQKGLLKIKLQYSHAIYNSLKNYDEIKIYTYSLDPSEGGGGKPNFKLASVTSTGDTIRLDFDYGQNKAILTDTTQEESKSPYTTSFKVHFLNILEESGISLSNSVVTDGIEINNVHGNFVQGDYIITFDMVYKAAASTFKYNQDTVVLQFVPQNSALYGNGNTPIEVTINAIRKPAIKFYTPTFTASKFTDGVKQDANGFYTELKMPAKAETENVDLVYDIYRKDDRSDKFYKIDSVNSQQTYKDYNALIYKNAEQEYKIVASLDGVTSAESVVVKGSRQLTNEEFLIAAMETIRYALIDKDIHSMNSNPKVNETVNGENGGTAGHYREYHSSIGYNHEYTFKSYKPFFTTAGTSLGQKLTYKRSGGTPDDIANNGGGGTLAPKAPLAGLISVETPFGKGTVTFNNVNIDDNDWNNPKWSTGTIAVEYNGQTRTYNKDNWFIPIFMNDATFKTKINATDYKQLNGGTITSGGIFWVAIGNPQIPETGATFETSGITDTEINFTDTSYSNATVQFDVILDNLIDGKNIGVSFENTNTVLVTNVAFSSTNLNTTNKSTTVTLNVNTSASKGNQTGFVKIKFALGSEYSNVNVKELLVNVTSTHSSVSQVVLQNVQYNGAIVSPSGNNYAVSVTDLTWNESLQSITKTIKLNISGVQSAKPIDLQIVSQNGVTVGNKVINNNYVSFDVTLPKAKLLQDISGSVVVKITGANYSSLPNDITLQITRTKSIALFDFTASTLENGEKKDTDGKYFTELILPAVDESVTYEIYRTDDSATDKLIDTVPNTVGVETVYKDKNALIYKTPTQTYFVKVKQGNVIHKETAKVTGSRQITNREFLIAVSESIRWALIDADNVTGAQTKGNGIFRIRGTDLLSFTGTYNYKTTSKNGGEAIHKKEYYYKFPGAAFTHTYSFVEYSPYFIKFNGSFIYKDYGEANDICSSEQAYTGSITTSSIYSGKVEFNSVVLTSDTTANPAWSSGNISVTYNGSTNTYTNSNWRFVIYNTDTEFRNYINAASYAQQ